MSKRFNKKKENLNISYHSFKGYCKHACSYNVIKKFEEKYVKYI